jgi:uncharacterized hydrophobic protein (TIGR00271 family)
MSFLTRTWRRLNGEWRTLIEGPLSHADVRAAMQQASVPYFGFYFMLGLAVVIATFGLLSNSAPTIIGAMIIAPLMAPIISLSFGIVDTDWALAVRSILTVVSGVVTVVLLAYGVTMGVGLRVAGSEIIGRSSPTLLDMGVAMAAGAAAAFAQTRRSIVSSIAGVAIAVALVPPLAVAGIGLAQGQSVGTDIGISLGQVGLAGGGVNIATGAFLLFLTNLAGIVIVAGIVFLALGYGRWLKGAPGLALVAVLSLLLFRPLGVSLERLYVRGQVLSQMSLLRQNYPELFTGKGRLDSIFVDYQGDVVRVTVTATVQREMLQDMRSRIDKFQNYLAAALRRPIIMEVQVVPVDVIDYRAGPEVKSDRSDVSPKR